MLASPLLYSGLRTVHYSGHSELRSIYLCSSLILLYPAIKFYHTFSWSGQKIRGQVFYNTLFGSRFQHPHSLICQDLNNKQRKYAHLEKQKRVLKFILVNYPFKRKEWWWYGGMMLLLLLILLFLVQYTQHNTVNSFPHIHSSYSSVANGGGSSPFPSSHRHSPSL